MASDQKANTTQAEPEDGRTVNTQQSQRDGASKGCHDHGQGHIFCGEQQQEHDGRGDETCAPINEKDGRSAHQKPFAALEMVPDGKAVTQHGEKTRKGGAQRVRAEAAAEEGTEYQTEKNTLENIKNKDEPGVTTSVYSLKVGESRIFAAKFPNVLMVNQVGKNDGRVDAAETVGTQGANKT